MVTGVSLLVFLCSLDDIICPLMYDFLFFVFLLYPKKGNIELREEAITAWSCKVKGVGLGIQGQVWEICDVQASVQMMSSHFSES